MFFREITCCINLPGFLRCSFLERTSRHIRRVPLYTWNTFCKWKNTFGQNSIWHFEKHSKKLFWNHLYNILLYKKPDIMPTEKYNNISIISNIFQNLMTTKQESDLSITIVWLQMELDDTRSCYQLTITVTNKNTFRTNIYSRDNV